MFEAPPRLDRSVALDALRAVLAIWVLFTHLVPAANTLIGGYPDLEAVRRFVVQVFDSDGETHPAVLCFIVLSGYCIHRNGLRLSRSNVKAYAIRRVFRIVPTYLLGSILGWLVYEWLFHGHKAQLEVLTAVDKPSLVNLLRKLSCLSSWAEGWWFTSRQGNDPIMTVGVEIWLYAIYGLVFIICRRIGHTTHVVGLLGVAWIASFVVYQRLGMRFTWQWWQNGSVMAFLPYWWIGALCASEPVGAFISRWTGAWVAAWLPLSVWSMSGHAMTAGVIECKKVLFGLACAAAIRGLDKVRARRFLGLAFLGKASYSIYALHFPLIFLFLVAGVPLWPTAALVVAIGVAFYLSVEHPLDQFGRRLARRRDHSDAASGAGQ